MNAPVDRRPERSEESMLTCMMKSERDPGRRLTHENQPNEQRFIVPSSPLFGEVNNGLVLPGPVLLFVSFVCFVGHSDCVAPAEAA